jgi:hypothetical protein
MAGSPAATGQRRRKAQARQSPAEQLGGGMSGLRVLGSEDLHSSKMQEYVFWLGGTGEPCLSSTPFMKVGKSHEMVNLHCFSIWIVI